MGAQSSPNETTANPFQIWQKYACQQRNDALDFVANLLTEKELLGNQVKALEAELATRDGAIATLRADLVKAHEDFDVKLADLKAEIEQEITPPPPVADGTAEVPVEHTAA